MQYCSYMLLLWYCVWHSTTALLCVCIYAHLHVPCIRLYTCMCICAMYVCAWACRSMKKTFELCSIFTILYIILKISCVNKHGFFLNFRNNSKIISSFCYSIKFYFIISHSVLSALFYDLPNTKNSQHLYLSNYWICFRWRQVSPTAGNWRAIWGDGWRERDAKGEVKWKERDGCSHRIQL